LIFFGQFRHVCSGCGLSVWRIVVIDPDLPMPAITCMTYGKPRKRTRRIRRLRVYGFADQRGIGYFNRPLKSRRGKFEIQPPQIRQTQNQTENATGQKVSF
jgi:hypothetical protein